MSQRLLRAVLFAVAIQSVLGAAPAAGEPMFLTKQYTRCTACHYSPSGGGLLTPYGRALSGRELSTTTGGTAPSEPGAQGSAEGEEAFLWGALGDILDPLQLGVDLRPSRLHYSIGGIGSSRKILMNADVIGAYQKDGWTLYGEIGREPTTGGSKIHSYEYWARHESTGGIGVRVGRFLPAYGVRVADHTSFNRSFLGFEKYDQLYGLEVSLTTERTLTQVTVSPGRADSIIHDDGRRALTVVGRAQLDVGPRQAIVASGIFRKASRFDPRSGAFGIAHGISPVRRLSVWTGADVQMRQGSLQTISFVVVNETSYEAFRGLWLTLSPQLRTAPDSISGDSRRLVLSANLLPRAHINPSVSYYRDRNTLSGLTVSTWLAQLHLYL